MRNKTSLVLMELLVMVLVFALASAICLRVFVRSYEISEATADRDRAVHLAQNAAEQLKGCADAEAAARLLGGVPSDDGWIVYYDRDGRPAETEQDCDFLLFISPPSAAVQGLGQARIRIFAAAGASEALFELNVAWQEVVQ